MKHQQLHPAIKIQKVWRGYSLRLKFRKYANRERSEVQVLTRVVRGWRQYVKRMRKLRAIEDVMDSNSREESKLDRMKINKRMR